MRELREKSNSITTRSGVVVRKGIGYNLQSKERDIESEEERKGEERKIDRGWKKEEDEKNKSVEREEKKNIRGYRKKRKKKEKENEKRSVPIVDLPYPHALSKKNIEGRFVRYV